MDNLYLKDNFLSTYNFDRWIDLLVLRSLKCRGEGKKTPNKPHNNNNSTYSEENLN